MPNLYVAPAIEQFINLLKIDYSSFTVSYILLWFFVIYIVVRARKNRIHDKVIETEYEPPSEISAVLARYLLIAGRIGGMSGEISENGLQRIILIDLYENGALKKLNFLDEETIEYELDETYKDKKLKEEQIIFIELLKKHVGEKATIKNKDPEELDKGFAGIDNFWFEYWNTELLNICIKQGYVDGKIIKRDIIPNLLAFSMTFGVFFSIFLILFIPFVGPFIALVLLFPVVIIFLFSMVFVNIISSFSGGYQIPFELLPEPLLVFLFVVMPFLTWFIWFILLGQNAKMAFTSFTAKGKDIIRAINGYKEFLKKVDKDRISFSLDRDLDFQRNNTTFSWLAIFSMVTDRHSEQFYEIHSKNSTIKIDTFI
jgi:hypothetical protein